jgi:multiple sugar transport system substrate-binding protein
MMTLFSKKVVCSLIIFTLVCITGAGCSSSKLTNTPRNSDSATTNTDSADNADKASKSSASVELQWLVRSDPAAQPWEKQLIKDFEKEYPNIKVKLVIVPQAQIDQKMQTMIASGTLSDVFSANWANAGFMTYEKSLLDLTPYVTTSPEVLDGVNPKIVDIWKVQGKLKALPLSCLGSFLFYNKDLYDQAKLPYPPTNWDDLSWTWDKMVENAKVLTNNIGNTQKQVFGLHNGLWPPNADAWMYGGDYFTNESYLTGDIGEPTVSDPGVRKGIQAHYDLIHKYKVSPSSSEMKALSALGDPFLTGKVAMIMTGGWGFWVYKPAKFHWGVAALPYVEGRRPVMFVDIMNISATTKHPEESWELLKWIADPKKGMKGYMEITQATPPHDGLLDEWLTMMSGKLGQSEDELKQVQNGAIKYGAESANHMLNGYAAIDQVLSQSLGAVYDGTKDIDVALKEIDSGIRALKLKK